MTRLDSSALSIGPIGRLAFPGVFSGVFGEKSPPSGKPAIGHEGEDGGAEEGDDPGGEALEAVGGAAMENVAEEVIKRSHMNIYR